MRQRADLIEIFHSRWLAALLVGLSFLLSVGVAAGLPDAEVLPPGVAVRQGPATTAAVVAELPGGAQVEVLLTQRGPGGDWAQVALPSGGTGFVPDNTLRRLTKPPEWRSYGSGSSVPSMARRVGQDVLDIPLRRIGGALLVTARINSQVTAFFIVDTGASTVTISHAVANKLGIDYASQPKRPFVTASGFVASPMIVLESIYVPDEAGAGVARVEAAVSTLPGAPPGIAGLLGQTFLRHFRVTIDAERGVLHLEPNPVTRGTRP